MENLVTIASLFKQWEADVKPHVYEMFGECQDSYIESWMEFLDLPLARDQITSLQWAFAENYLEVAQYTNSWAEEFSRLLTLLGVELKSYFCSDVDIFGTATYHYVLERHGKTINGVYSLPVEKGEPSRDDILECLFLEYSEFEECQNDYGYYCQKYQLDENEAESKSLYDQSEKLFQELPDLFAHNTTLTRDEIVSGFADIVWKM
nr:hypothetical protein [Providencia rettgeri]